MAIKQEIVKRVLKAGQEGPEETGLKNKDYHNSDTLKLGKLSIGLNPKKKTMIVTSLVLIAFTILSFLYNEKGLQAISFILNKISQTSVKEKYREILPQAKEEAKRRILMEYGDYHERGKQNFIEWSLRKINDGPIFEDIAKTPAYSQYKDFSTSERLKYYDRLQAFETIGKWLKYTSYLTGALGLIFLLAGLLKSEDSNVSVRD